MILKTVRNLTPQIGKNVFIAENATLIGDVQVADQASIWYQVVLRGDVAKIQLGARSNIQDGSIVHGSYKYSETIIEDDVTIGHQVVLHGCRIGSFSLIGMGTIILDKAVIPKYSLVGAGSLILEGATFPEGHLIVGRPAKAKRPLTEEEKRSLEESVQNYLFYKTWYALA